MSRIATVAYLKNFQAMAWAAAAAAAYGLSPAVVKVYKFVASDTDFRTWRRATHCIAYIAKACRLAYVTVCRALRLLKDVGLLACDGYGRMPPRGGRPVVHYRLAGTPLAPLPWHVLCARENHDPADSCTYCLTCKKIDTPESPTTAVPASGPSSHLPDPAPSRSAEGVRSDCANPRESVNGNPKQRHPRPAPTPPKGRPTPRRATRAPRAPHPALELVAHVVAKLTPGQLRHVHARLHATMREQGIGPARMAERLRHWAHQEARDPMAWLLYAIKTPPHGCPRPDCENGTLWDPGADAPAGPCGGCSERIRDRAAEQRDAATPPLRTPAAARLDHKRWVPSPLDFDDELYGPRRRNDDGTFNNGPADVPEWHCARTALKDRNRARKERP